MTLEQTPLILIANPGSASRKYGLFRGGKIVADLHFEYEDGKVICTVDTGSESHSEPVGVDNIESVISYVRPMLLRTGLLREGDLIAAIGLRIVAPSGYFLDNHLVNDEMLDKLRQLQPVAPLHIDIMLREIELLRNEFVNLPIYAISDSRFHRSKPQYAWNYGLPLDKADEFELKRFGYHGLSVKSAVHQLERNNRLANKVIVAHIGSGVSVTAVLSGKSLDNSMGYSPLEGVVMASRVGNVDYNAIKALQIRTGMSDDELESMLNHHAGLKGLGESSDVRELVSREKAGNDRASLALSTYVYNLQKAIAQMTAALGGVDALVFTGTVGERSSIIRQRIIARLHYLDFIIDENKNDACTNPQSLETISKTGASKPIHVVHADEATEIARQVNEMFTL